VAVLFYFDANNTVTPTCMCCYEMRTLMLEILTSIEIIRFILWVL